jgi:pimeloyl-ACP methyl ester carboxylesterase
MSRLILVLAAFGVVATQPSAQRLAVPGGELVYDVSGPPGAPAIVMLHGAFMDRRTWDRATTALARDYRVVRFDIRPFGESSVPASPYSVPDDILRVLDALKIARAHLMGHSFGGGMALDFTLLHPDRVASLMLVSAGPGGFVPPDDERKLAGAIFAAVKNGDDAIVAAWLAHPMWAESRERPELRAELEQITRRNLAPFRMAAPPFVPLTPPAMGRLAEIKAPTLVIVGDRDTPGNRMASEQLAKGIPGARSLVVAGADHGLPLGWSRELVEAALGFVAAARR